MCPSKLLTGNEPRVGNGLEWSRAWDNRLFKRAANYQIYPASFNLSESKWETEQKDSVGVETDAMALINDAIEDLSTKL